MAIGSDDSRPASLQVAATLRSEIVSGKLSPGDKLPSIRNLAERFGVAPMTANSAIDILRNDGLVYTSPGRGTFVRSVPREPETDEPSPEYVAISEHLNDLDSQMRAMADRVDKLEKLVRHDDQAQR